MMRDLQSKEQKHTRMQYRVLSLLVLLAGVLRVVDCDVSITVVSLKDVDRDPNPNYGVYFATQAAAGLANRNGPLVYILDSQDDEFWMDSLLLTAKKTHISWQDFLHASYAKYGGILFNEEAEDMLPSVATVAGVLSAVPINAALLSTYSNTTIVFDSTNAWSSVEDAVNSTANAYLQQTSSLAFQSGQLILRGYLVDWLVQQRLFTQYMPSGCVPLSGQKSLLRSIVDRSPWPLPVRVYGYNSLNPLFGGDLWEAETDCIDVMGQIATSQASNLAFWSQLDKFDPSLAPGQPLGPLVQAPQLPEIVYNASKTYVALVYGDMDNIVFVEGFAKQHMLAREKQCGGLNDKFTCFPLTWTLSPNLIEVAPQIMRWYYQRGAATGRDWFIMPPSGTLYSYPGVMPSNVQADYVQQQNQQAYIMNTEGSVHWEWIFTWKHAWDSYFPRYQNTSGTHYFFLNNVPWVFPIPGMELEHETYRVVADNVVGFKPAFNWQENGPSGGDPGNSTAIAARTNNLRVGSLQYIYVIQNTPYTSIADMVTQLDDHVELVSYMQLAQLALARNAQRLN